MDATATPYRRRVSPRQAHAVLRRVEHAEAPVGIKTADQRKRLLVNFCRIVETHLKGSGTTPSPNPSAAAPIANPPTSPTDGVPSLPPRMRQTLARLLAGDAEKQIATHLGVSPHTVHEYVKKIYRRFAVNSRGELLSRFVNTATRLEPANSFHPF